MTNSTFEPAAETGDRVGAESESTCLHAEDIRDACVEMSDTMDALSGLLDTENRLLRSGKLQQATHLHTEKIRLAESYTRFANLLARHVGLAQEHCPTLADKLAYKHERFRATLEENMSLTAAARDASEALLKDVASAAASESATQTYAPSGRVQNQAPRTESVGLLSDSA